MDEPRLVDVYAQEAAEAFDRVVEALLRVEAAGTTPAQRAEALRQALATLHGAKGGALVVDGLAPVAALLHAVEAAVGKLDAAAPPAAGALDAPLAAIDACRALTAGATGATAPRVDVDAALRALGVSPEPAPAGAPAAATPEEVEAPAPAGVAAESIRVSLADLDALLRALAELSAGGAALARRVEEVEALAWAARDQGRRAEEPAAAAQRDGLERLARALRADEHRLGRVVRDARACAGRMRLQPFSTTFEPLRRAVREVARRTGKSARLVTDGGAVLVDKRALDALRAPLMHLVRNGVDHGLEDAATRARAGKPAEGAVRVGARRVGDRVLVSVEDDGRGVDLDALRDRARALGGVSPDAGLLDLLGTPGLSTRAEADEVSGRGLGVAAVRDAVDRIGGRLDVTTRPGQGTRFALALPLEVAARRGLLVVAGGLPAYLPAAHVVRLVRDVAGRTLRLDGRRALQTDDGPPLPVVRLADVLGRAAADGRATFVVLDAPGGRCAVEVERVEAQEELVVQPLRRPLVRLRAVEGVVVRDDGAVVPLVDLRGLRGEVASAAPALEAAASPAAPRILVVDDSITTRTLEKNVLEGAGMEVQLAQDGQEALGLIAEGREFDLVVSDIEMPRLDGIELVRALRRRHAREALPVVLVTSLEDDAVRARGLEAGADALIVKRRFDNEHLLAVVRALLARRAQAGRGA